MREATRDDSRIKLMAVGDLMLGEHHLSLRNGVATTLFKKGLDPFQFVLDKFKTYDLLLGNLECVISDRSEVKGIERFAMRSPPILARILKRTGFDCVCVANNHSMDHGPDAFNDMCHYLESAGIKFCGTESDPVVLPLKVNSDAKQFGIFGVSFRPNATPYSPLYNIVTSNSELSSICERIREVKKEVDFVFIQCHWGDEFIHIPSPDQISTAKKLVDSGVDLIIGHHPHVYQGHRIINGAPVFFSLGNFVSDMSPTYVRKGAAASVNISGDSIVDAKTLPICIDDIYRPHFSSDPKIQESMNNIDRWSSIFYKHWGAEKYKVLAEQASSRYRKHLWKNFVVTVNEFPGIKKEIIMKKILDLLLSSPFMGERKR